MHGREQEVPGRVAGEHPTRPVAAMGGRGEADDEDPRRGVAEPGHRPAPVRLVAESSDLLAGDAFTPLDEPRTAAAGDDLRGQLGQGRPAVEDVVRHDAYFSRSLSRRLDAIVSPISPMTVR